MGWLRFQMRPASRPEIADFGSLNGPRSLQNQFQMVGRFAPHHFGWVSKRFRTGKSTNIDDFRSRNRPDLKTQQSNFQTYLTLNVSMKWPRTFNL